jgi:hypothetical protein
LLVHTCDRLKVDHLPRYKQWKYRFYEDEGGKVHKRRRKDRKSHFGACEAKWSGGWYVVTCKGWNGGWMDLWLQANLKAAGRIALFN